MKAAGLRLPLDRLKARLKNLREHCRPEDFKQDLDEYTTRTLKTAMNATPVRRPSLIRRNQKKQWLNRINFIPTNHRLTDPALRVKEDGTKVVYMGGKWYLPDRNRVPGPVWTAFQLLNAERERRMSRISEGDFIYSREQARFLYRKSWWQIGLSLKLPVLASANTQDAVTRRRKPAVEPPRAFGIPRGGKTVISYAIYNPFLALPSRYINFDAQTILQNAAMQNKPAFIRRVENRVRRAQYAARKQ